MNYNLQLPYFSSCLQRAQNVISEHDLRRTLATLLQSSGASVKTTQERLRHSSPVMTMGTYAKAVTADKRNAQDAIAALFVEKDN
jgi:integrase